MCRYISMYVYSHIYKEAGEQEIIVIPYVLIVCVCIDINECMYVCIYVCMYVCMYATIHTYIKKMSAEVIIVIMCMICTSECLCIYIYIYMYERVYMYTYTCVSECIFTHIRV